MSRTTENLIRLADTLARHEDVTHWAISRRLLSKSDFFKLLRDGREPRVDTCERVMDGLAGLWPADLEWPADIPRPPAVAAGNQRRAAS